MAISSLLVPGVSIPQPDHSWISGAFDGIGGAIQRGKQNQSFNKLADLIAAQPQAAVQQPSGGLLSSLMPQAGPQTSAAPVMPVQRGKAQGSTYKPFIETVRAGGLTNPNALAAVAAYGDAESGWSPKNAVSTWSDPSQSGQPGTSGGILSWRGDRYARLAAGGDLSPEAQARYFLQEDPQLIAALNQAKSPEEAAQLMANAWKFAGYDKPGGEGARRSALARNYFANDFANEQPTNAVAAIEAQAPGGMGSPLTDQAFDDRFGAAPLPVDQIQGKEALAARLTETNAQPVAPGMEAAPVAAETPAFAPTQVADASGTFMGVPGVQPIARGTVNPEIIQFMLRDPNLREMGLKLWAQNAGQQNTAEPWQFVTLPDGTLARANQQTGSVEPIGNFAKAKTGNPTALMQNLEAAGLKPGTKEYRDAVLAGTKGGITVNTGDASGSGAFYKKADELRAGTIVDAATAGMDARRRIVQIDQLGQLLGNVETGGLAAVKQLAGEWGINTEGLNDIQAAQALINQMVPSQRPPGSGTMSDADLALFKQSIPRIINQPGGNELIIRTMQEIATYDQQIGDIANRILNRDLNPAEGAEEMRKVRNPLEGFGRRVNQTGGGKGARNGGETQYQRAVNPQTGEVIELRNGQWVKVQ